MKKKKAKKIKTKKSAPNFYGLGKFNYLIFKLKFLKKLSKLLNLCIVYEWLKLQKISGIR